MRVMIGISGSHEQDPERFFIKTNYMEAVLRAGGIPLLLPETNDEGVIDDILSELDGLLLAGGGDVDPSLYGENRLDECDAPDELRDSFEMIITRKALALQMPILGICRGIQVLNVAMGGTLIQDIPSACGLSKTAHRQNPPYDNPAHLVHAIPGGLLANVIGSETMSVNSMHHQAVKVIAPGTIIEAKSEDGIIEAMSLCGRENVLAVQFHPEYLESSSPKAHALFSHLINNAELYRSLKD